MMRLLKVEKIFVLFFTMFLMPVTASADLTSYIDEHNRFILNGEPFFPLGLYVVECTNGSYAAELDEIADSPGSYAAELDEIADSPFDTLMNYAVNQCGSDATDAQILGYLDQLVNDQAQPPRDLKLIFSLSEYFDGGQADIDTITHKVNTFKSHPAVISWYLNDERDPAVYLTQLEERYDKIRELDENHPVWSVHWNTNWLLQEAHTTDIAGMDNYPIAHRPITDVSAVVDAAMPTGKPLWFVPQIFNWQDYPWDFRAPTGRPPTRAEMRAMTYLATNHGAKGLIYYSYFNIRDDGDDYIARWPQIKKIAGEIEQLRPVFLSIDQTNDSDIICNNPSIDIKLMREGGTYYLFAVNIREEVIKDVSFGIDMNLLDKPSSFAVLFEGNKHLVYNDSFTDNFGPYEVHVYEGNTDIDSDGWSDIQDNCPFTPNPSSNPTQDDSDGDGIGDACDRGDLRVEGTNGVITVNVLDPEDAQFDSPDKPENLIYGVIEVTSSTADEIAVIKITLPSPAPNDYKWYKFTKTGEWIDFSRDAISNGVGEGAEFNQDRTTVTLFIRDNDLYDADAQPRIVKDPSGLGMAASAPPSPEDDNGGNDNAASTPSSSGGGGGGGCFITTAGHEPI